MSLLQTLIAFIVALSVLIVVHELGHYWVARLCNVKVLRFSLGMGKIIYSRRFGKDETEWALSILPFGGYVKLLDARTEDFNEVLPEEHEREFTRQSVWRRFAIVAAGSLANFLLAILLLAGLYIYGIPEPLARLDAVPEKTIAYQAGLRGGDKIISVNKAVTNTWPDVRLRIADAVMERKPVTVKVQRVDNTAVGANKEMEFILPLQNLPEVDLEKDFMGVIGLALAKPPAIIGELVSDGPAVKAGLQTGDRVLSINGMPVENGVAFIETIRTSPGKMLSVDVLRGENKIDFELIPEAYRENDLVVGRIQAKISLAPEMQTVRYSVFSATQKGVAKTWDTTILTLKVIGKMITGDVSLRNITGPITIADYAGQTARAGIIRYLHFIVFISISIGVMNLLPIPVLDGGLLLYYSIEMLIGRPISERFTEIAYRFGLAMLVMLLAIATFNDLNRLFN